MILVEHLKTLTPQRREQILGRSTLDLGSTLERTKTILESLRKSPARELQKEYGTFPDYSLESIKIADEELATAHELLPSDFKKALETAAESIRRFHAAQKDKPIWLEEFAPGLLAGQMTKPLERVGVYIPGGRAAYPSSALMNIIPAKVAGVKEIIATTPPGIDGSVRPEILAAAHLAGATSVYKLGGAWAVGCLAYGLGGVPQVDKIVGPGSSWVTAAKMAVFGQVDIDSPAGPSEGFIVADETAQSRWLAWDLLSQLEHDPQAAAVLVTTCSYLAQEVADIVNELLPSLERAEIVAESIKGGGAILVVDKITEAIDFANEYAPEHLQLVLANPMSYLTSIQNAGSIFLGPYATIPVGDYASGTNHVLPTGMGARMFSGLSTAAFEKKISFQQLDAQALVDLAPTVTTLARAEGLYAHAEAVEIRLKK